MMKLISYGLSDVGLMRSHNEDAYYLDDELGLYVVADGMGGHAKGEVASAQAVESLVGMMRKGVGVLEALVKEPSPERIRGIFRLLVSSVQAASYMVHSLSEMEPQAKGMGTTVSALLIQEDMAFIGQVGDSRIYLIRYGKAEQLTEDHTLVAEDIRQGRLTPEEARFVSYSNVITRSVGSKDYVEVDTYFLKAQPGDIFLLCSDGLYSYLSMEEMAEILLRVPRDKGAAELVELANLRGGSDNITVIVCFIDLE